jgi:FKBP-type peptidyl-prolyl cis-trans isomerase
MFYVSYAPPAPFAPFMPAGQGKQFGYGSMTDQEAALAAQGVDLTAALLTKGLTAHSAKKLEQEKRATAKATQKYTSKTAASEAKKQQAAARAAEAEAEARKAEAAQAAKAQTTKYVVLGLVSLATLGTVVFISKAVRSHAP